LNVYRLFTDPSDQNALYLSTRGQGLFYSYDNGDTWRTAPGMGSAYIYGLSVDPKSKCVIYITDGLHIYKTTDCMRTWALMFTEERPSQRFVDVVVDYGNSNIIYAAQLGGDILQSKDAGASWRIIKRFGFEVRLMEADPFKSGRLYVAAYRNGLHRTDDGGNNWTDVSKGITDFSDGKSFYRFVLNKGKKDSIYWVSKYGILRSDDAGGTWSDIKLLTPPGSVNIYSFAVNPINQSELYYTGTVLNDKGQNLRSTFYKTVDGGNNWVTKKLPTNTIPVAMLVHIKNTSMLFVGFTADEAGAKQQTGWTF